MKTKLTLLAIILVSGALWSSCKKDPPPAKTPEQEQTEKLAKTWILASGATAVTINSVDVSEDWASFELTFTDGGYTSTNANAAEVWPGSGTWSFATDDVTTLLRNDGTEITVNVTENALLMQFTYSSTGGRLDGTDGNWVFNMIPK
jgi:uncharacterized protein YndB with AHSA1/START domain